MRDFPWSIFFEFNNGDAGELRRLLKKHYLPRTEEQREILESSIVNGKRMILALAKKLEEAIEKRDPINEKIKLFSIDPTHGEPYERDINFIELLSMMDALGVDIRNVPKEIEVSEDASIVTYHHAMVVSDREGHTIGQLELTYRGENIPGGKGLVPDIAEIFLHVESIDKTGMIESGQEKELVEAQV